MLEPSKNCVAVDNVPLCVDLDGTLVRSDTLVEGFARLVRRNLWNCMAVLRWLLRGRAQLKAEIAARVELDVALLPANEALLAWLRQEHRSGRRVILCTAANESIARRIAAYYAVFDEVIASSEHHNLKGKAKAECLVSKFGVQGYDYAGNDLQDLHVWAQARKAIVVTPTRGLQRELARLPRVDRIFPNETKPGKSWLRALRLHQWSKNILIFLPAAGAHRLLQHDVALASAAAFVIFGVCASGTYLLNDLMDLDADRRHPTKRNRPFAAGTLPLAHAFFVIPALVGAALLLAALLVGWPFLAVLVIYVVATVWYSRSLKRIAMVDVLALAGLYAVRVIAGAAATAIVPSFWLLAFTMFLFLSLAMAKRYSELKLMIASGRTHTVGRGYTIDDAPLLQACGVASGYIGVLVIALYVNSGIAQNMYGRPEFLWLLCPLLLYWNTRVWLKTSRGQMHDDPVVFTLQDRPSLIAAGLGLLLIFAAI